MRIVCCANMPFAREAFRTLGAVVVVEGRSITADDVRDADVLAIRSTTAVNRELLDGSRVRFVGTATIGTDHMDLAYLGRAGIRWCAAPGCNANSVSEYVTAALLDLARRHAFRLEGRTLGVVGVGNVGRRVVDKARALGMNVLRNDPPRLRSEGGDFVSLETVLDDADVVTLHVPLTDVGPDATRHMADGAFFSKMRAGALFVNSARGAVLRTDALLSALHRGAVRHAVIDTWEGEPAIRSDLLAAVELGTPHIAGYSFDGKVAGTVMVYREVCRFLDVQPRWTPDCLLPAPTVPEIRTRAAGRDEEDVLHEIVCRVYDIRADHLRLLAGATAPGADLAGHFDGLRRRYPVRREFGCTRVRIPDASARLRRKIHGLGFRLDPNSTTCR